MTHTEKGGKNSNDRVASPESIPIHLKACCDRVVGLSSLLGHAAIFWYETCCQDPHYLQKFPICSLN